MNNSPFSPRIMNLLDNAVPSNNMEASRLLYVLEVGLRELLIEKLAEVDGNRWWKSRLPGDVLSKYKEALEFRRNIPWKQSIAHHPIYYVDFPDLSKVIALKNNWNDVFSHIFGRNKEIFSSSLSKIEPIRNSVAHNRKVSHEEMITLEDTCNFLGKTIGWDALLDLSMKCTEALDIPERIKLLDDEIDGLIQACQCCEIVELSIWPTMKNEWWFDEDYLGVPLENVYIFFRAIDTYVKLPRSRGTGHIIEAWVQASNIEPQATSAKAAIQGLAQ